VIEPTDIKVVQAEDGSKALAIELVLIVPFDEVFGINLASQLLPAQANDDQSTTEQDNTEDTNA
jgi:hypothetical protein